MARVERVRESPRTALCVADGHSGDGKGGGEGWSAVFVARRKQLVSVWSGREYIRSRAESAFRRRSLEIDVANCVRTWQNGLETPAFPPTAIAPRCSLLWRRSSALFQLSALRVASGGKWGGGGRSGVALDWRTRRRIAAACVLSAAPPLLLPPPPDNDGV